jgi:hypothetical protein
MKQRASGTRVMVAVGVAALLGTAACEPNPDTTPTPMDAPFGTPPPGTPGEAANVGTASVADRQAIRRWIEPLERSAATLRTYHASIEHESVAGAGQVARLRHAELGVAVDSVNLVLRELTGGGEVTPEVAVRMLGIPVEEHRTLQTDLALLAQEASELPAARRGTLARDHTARVGRVQGTLDRMLVHMRTAVGDSRPMAPAGG